MTSNPSNLRRGEVSPNLGDGDLFGSGFSISKSMRKVGTPAELAMKNTYRIFNPQNAANVQSKLHWDPKGFHVNFHTCMLRCRCCLGSGVP